MTFLSFCDQLIWFISTCAHPCGRLVDPKLIINHPSWIARTGLKWFVKLIHMWRFLCCSINCNKERHVFSGRHCQLSCPPDTLPFRVRDKAGARYLETYLSHCHWLGSQAGYDRDKKNCQSWLGSQHWNSLFPSLFGNHWEPFVLEGDGWPNHQDPVYHVVLKGVGLYPYCIYTGHWSPFFVKWG
jgi:hypothetical protein